MKKYLVRLCQIAVAVLLVCHLDSCKDPAITDRDNSVGLPAIGLEHLDTSTIILSTVADLQLQGSAVSVGTLGSMDDPNFGKTFAGFYAQCLLSSNGAFFESGTVVDSVILYLPYVSDSSKYGPCTSPVDILVYEVSQYIDPTIVYHSNDVFNVYGQTIGRINGYKPDLKDSTVVLGVNAAPQISVRLSNAFAQKLLSADSTSLSSSNDFINYMKGIYVTTNSATVGNGVTYIQLQSSKISMYYHNSTSTGLQFDFPITSYSSTVNHIDHQYATPVRAALNNATNNAAAYIQAASGTRIKMRVPTLSNLPKNIGITKAELILPVDVSDTARYPLPNFVTLYRIDDTLALQVLNSYNLSGTGSLQTRTENGINYYAYVFNLT